MLIKNVLVTKRMAELAERNIDTSRITTYGDYRALLDRKDMTRSLSARPITGTF